MTTTPDELLLAKMIADTKARRLKFSQNTFQKFNDEQELTHVCAMAAAGLKEDDTYSSFDRASNVVRAAGLSIRSVIWGSDGYDYDNPPCTPDEVLGVKGYDLGCAFREFFTVDE